jgi:hypothetical protein
MLIAFGTYGTVQAFLDKQIATLTIVRGGTTTVVDVSALWSGPFLLAPGVWASVLFYSLGSLTPGESVLVQTHLTLKTPLLQVFLPVGPTGENGPDLCRGDDIDFGGCLITAA